MSAIDWPTILVPRSNLWHLKPLIQQGPVTFSGRAQKGSPSAGYWTATLSDFAINKPDKVREFRALVAALEGGLGRVLVGPCECERAPHGEGERIGNIPYSDQSRHSDGAGFRQAGIVMHVNVYAFAGAVTLSVALTHSGPLRRGMYFSVNDHLHVVTRVETPDPNGALITFLPPLREAAGEFSPVEFEKPRCVMRLATADSGQLTLDLNRFGSPSLQLEESFDAVF